MLAKLSCTLLGRGFVGTAIAAVLEQSGCQFAWLGSKKFNLCQTETWESFTSSETVIIAAGEISNDIDKLYATNERPVAQLCDLFAQKGVKKIVLLSTGSVYGECDVDLHHSMDCRPNSNYGRSKLATENLYQENWKGDINILRLFYPYGPTQSLPRLVPQLIESIRNHKPIIINEDKGPIITLTHIDDLAQVICDEFVFSDNEQVIHNVASNYKTSIHDLAQCLAKGLGIEPIFETRAQRVSNCTSVPYEANWSNTGLFERLFI